VSDKPIGQRFSHVYMQQPELLSDSSRLRRRLAALYVAQEDLIRLRDAIVAELGLEQNVYLQFGPHWQPFLDKIELRDLLDSVTIRYQTIVDHYGKPDQPRRNAFVQSVQRIFREEHARYSVDDWGGVHFALDQEFERARVSAIAGLATARYNGVRKLFEEAYAALDGTPPDGKAGVRSSFFAVESLFRLMFPTVPRLGAAEVQKDLKPLIDRIFDGQKPAIHVAQKQVAAFIDWVDGAHFYRHEPGSEEPAQPPLDLAIVMISQAATYLRWLAELDQVAQSNRTAS
jgi:hypothetical protein